MELLDYIRYCINYDSEFALMLSILLFNRIDKFLKQMEAKQK